MGKTETQKILQTYANIKINPDVIEQEGEYINYLKKEKVSTDELKSFFEMAKGKSDDPLMVALLKYPHIPNELLDEVVDDIIENFSSKNVLLTKENVPLKQLRKIMDYYEKNHQELIDTLNDKSFPLSKAFVKYMTIFFTKEDMEMFEFTPLNHISPVYDKNIVEKVTDWFPENERAYTLLENNINIPSNVRNALFDVCYDLESLKNPTEYMAEKIYHSAVETMFDMGYGDDSEEYAELFDDASYAVYGLAEKGMLDNALGIDFLKRFENMPIADTEHTVYKIVQKSTSTRIFEEAATIENCGDRIKENILRNQTCNPIIIENMLRDNTSPSSGNLKMDIKGSYAANFCLRQMPKFYYEQLLKYKDPMIDRLMMGDIYVNKRSAGEGYEEMLSRYHMEILGKIKEELLYNPNISGENKIKTICYLTKNRTDNIEESLGKRDALKYTCFSKTAVEITLSQYNPYFNFYHDKEKKEIANILDSALKDFPTEEEKISLCKKEMQDIYDRSRIFESAPFVLIERLNEFCHVDRKKAMEMTEEETNDFIQKIKKETNEEGLDFLADKMAQGIPRNKETLQVPIRLMDEYALYLYKMSDIFEAVYEKLPLEKEFNKEYKPFVEILPEEEER